MSIKKVLHWRYLLRPTLFAAAVLVLLVSPAAESKSREILRSIDGTVIAVSDGDTLKVAVNGTVLKVRLAGVDCPETDKINYKTVKVNKPGQPFGKEAAAFVENLVLNKKVRVDVYGTDRYKRVLAFVYAGNVNINLELVRVGLAEVYKGGEFGEYKYLLANFQTQAKINKKGMWALGDKYESPREFRKRLKVSGE